MYDDLPENTEFNPAQEEAYLCMELLGCGIEHDACIIGYILDCDVHFLVNGVTCINVDIDTPDDVIEKLSLVLPTPLVFDDREKYHRYILSTIRYMLLAKVKDNKQLVSYFDMKTIKTY